MGEAVEIFYPNGFSKICSGTTNQSLDDESRQFDSWYEETIDEDLKWSFALKRFEPKLVHLPNNSSSQTKKDEKGQ